MNRTQEAQDTVHAARHTTRATRPQNEPSSRRPAGKKHHVRPPRPTVQPRPTGGDEEGRQAGQAGEKGQRDKAGKARGEEPNPPPQRTHTPLPRTGPRPGANRAGHGAKRARQREGVSPALRNSTPGQRARATRRPSRAHTQHRTPPRTTAQNTTPPRQTPTPDDERAAKDKSKPRSPHSATAAVRIDVCAPSKVPNPCRLRNSCHPDGRVCGRQYTEPLPATNQPPSG